MSNRSECRAYSLVAQSANAGEVLLSSALLNFRLGVARQRLCEDIRLELFRLGAEASDATVQKIIDGLPDDVLHREIAART
jgi:hypothetical protein